jgi:RND family efflux transporter MFP subunit
LKTKFIIPIAIGAAAIIILLWIFFGTGSAKSSSAIMVPVKKGPMSINVTTTGELQALNSEDIKGPFGMMAYEIYNVKISYLIAEGNQVKQGDLIAELDKSDFMSKLKDGGADLSKIESEYTQTRLDTALEMSKLRDELINEKFDMEEKKLLMDQSKFEPPSVIRQAEIDMEKAERTYKQSIKSYKLKLEQNRAKMQEKEATLSKQQSKIQQLQQMMEGLTIKAPKSGMLIYKKDWNGKKIKTGSTVNSWNPVVATLPDLSAMVSQTYVNEIDISKLKIGQNVEISIDAFPGHKYSGKVKSIENVGEQLPNTQTKVFEVNILVDQKDTLLRPAMTTSNIIQTKTLSSSTLYIPLDCIQGSDTFNYVFARLNGKTVKQEIVEGVSNEVNAEIKTGLNEGDMVYLSAPNDADKIPVNRLSKAIKDKFKKQTNTKPNPVETTSSNVTGSKSGIN